uniref:HTH_48 domain-containing protein n=1 Tax=Macrostomum lignano TaxID=282301 RepID=A0A1I8J415_9PLAT
MKFPFLQGKKPPDMFRELQQVLGNCAPTEQTFRKWYRLFAEGRESVGDNDRSGRPMTATYETVVKKVQELLDDDRLRTCEELGEDVGVSAGSVHTILTERLHLQKKFCKWVPHLLTGEDFLSRIVAGDETWVYSWDPETKAQSAEWLPAHSPRPQAIRKQGALKIMHVMFFDSQGILLNWAVPQGTTVNGDYYKSCAQQYERSAPGLLESGVILLHDNAPAHRKHNVVELLSKWGWEVLQHPS